MLKRDVEACRARLEEQLASLVGQGAATVHHMVENGDELPDPNDRATREEDRNWSLRLRDRDRKLIGKIEEALARIDAGTFGTCDACGRPISTARLRARPVTTLCLACKTDAERRER
ncbi:MAG TPA: RNA polymerase-binding protein DksA [Anaeromyxobacteraceae bacterium]|nr:RNA polymerase-binding protein DksA [Anaeromyxobacteraceae bacterium]